MKAVLFHAEAKEELREAARYYERQRAGLGSDCRAEIEAAVERIQRNPQAFKVVDDLGTRRCLVNRFPYSIIFQGNRGCDLDRRRRPSAPTMGLLGKSIS